MIADGDLILLKKITGRSMSAPTIQTDRYATNDTSLTGAVSLRDTFVQADKKLSLRTSDRRHWCGNPPE